MRTLLAIALIFLSVTAHGQAAPQVWSFTEILRQSIASHPSILSRRSTVGAAQADIESAEWQRFPSPSLEYVGGDAGTNPTSRLRVEQPLWTGGRITAGIDAARSRKDAAQSGVGESQNDIGFRVAAGYVEAARQQAREEFARKSVAEHERLLALISRRVTQEVSPLIDRELAQGRLYQSMDDLATTQKALRTALVQLVQLAGRPVERVAGLGVDLASMPPSQARALEMALAASPSLSRIAAEERAASADADSKRAALWPQVSVRFERDYGGAFPAQRLMFAVAANPGAGLSAASGVEAALARQRALQQERDAAVRTLQESVSTDWNDFVSARERRRNAELVRKSATEVFDSFTRQYTAGRKTWVDVVNSIRESTQAEYTVVDVTAQLALAALRLGIATGIFFPDAGRQAHE